MAICEGPGCKEELTGRQRRFHHDTCRNAAWSEARRRGAALGKGLDSLLPAKGKGKPHCGHPGRSKRLARTLNVLMEAKGAWITTFVIQQKTGSMKPSTDVDDLRRAGYPVSAARYVGMTDKGRKVYEYRWEGK